MAHASYDCCAVCDCKGTYNEQADAKATLCSDCAVNLAQKGVFVHNVSELISWMEMGVPSEVVNILDSVGFDTCFYPNAVDILYEKLRRGGE